jgi:hypothetical protein
MMGDNRTSKKATMTGDDLKRMQNGFLEASKKILLEECRLRPVGFIVTLHKHVDKLFESGWGIEFIDPKAWMRDVQDDNVATLIIDLMMDWKRLYHAVLNVFPQTRDVLPQMLALGESVGVDDVYKRTMRPFLKATQLDEKDVIAATLRQICDKVDAFASILHSEAWLRVVESTETVEKIRENAPKSLGQDKKSVEIVMSAMETYDFTRMLAVPIHREPSKNPRERDEGKVIGFGELTEGLDTPGDTNVIEGRLARFLKPLKDA